MTTQQLNTLLADARAKRLSRREVLKRAAALGLSAPAIAALLAACGGASATPTATESAAPTTPTTASGSASPTSVPSASPTNAATATPSAAERGGGGTLNILSWAAPTILNAHLSLATKDVKSVRIYGEPLADFNAKTELVPILAAEVPSIENGGVAADGTSVTWKLRQNVKWHDGEPFTAKDVAFTFSYLSDPKTAATTLGYYQSVAAVEALDTYTVKVTFKAPTAAWFVPFTGMPGQILPEHILKDFVGEKAKDSPFNLAPIGTGPFKVVQFVPGDVVEFEINQDFYEEGKPFFDRVVVKGGGDATSTARAVLQTGEADYAWDLSLEPEVLKSMETASKGKLVTWPGGGTAKLILNHSDPETEMDGQVSSYKVPHPHFKEANVRQALAFSIPRDVIANTLYGPRGTATGYTLNNNPQYMPEGITWEYNLDKARQLLDEVGAQPGPDGIRVLNGRRMSWVYSASQSSVSQKMQEIIKASLAQIGVDIQIKAVVSSVYFSAAQAESFQQLRMDLGMETNVAGVWPLQWYLRYYSGDPLIHIAQKENNWSGRNIQRYVNPEFNELWEKASVAVDKDEYTETYLKMQELAVTQVADIGLVAANNAVGVAADLAGYEPTPWAPEAWDIKNWTRTS